MPQPLSAMRIILRPPASTSTRRESAPASREFSRSSLTTEAGRSTTSPAAILFATWSGRTRIRPIALLYDDAPLIQKLARGIQQVEKVAAIVDGLDNHVRFGPDQIGLGLQHQEDLAGAQFVFLVLGVHPFLGEIARLDGQ